MVGSNSCKVTSAISEPSVVTAAMALSRSAGTRATCEKTAGSASSPPEIVQANTVAAAAVRDELLRRLVPGSSCCMYVFHDPNQTYTEAAVYPEGLTRVAPFDRIIRNPGRVRDAAVDFCGSLDRERGRTGRVVFHELHQQAVHGPEVRLVDVERTAVRRGFGSPEPWINIRLS